MGTYAESSFHEDTASRRVPSTRSRLALVAVFSAVVAVCTTIAIPLPPPVFEITLAPAVYLALAALADRWDAFAATALGGFVGELFNVATRGGSPIYPFGMVWARGPEALIVAWAARRGRRTLAGAMVAATVYETFAFLVPDWLFYSYGLFEYGSPTSLYTGLVSALPDLATLADLAFIPVAFAIIAAAGPTFRRLGYMP
ncbi:MAG: hypothetical protein JRM86_02325 [Nitrososphaerota archaeon]|nr:hypothetical protein [Nitrososphaerota archaeon]MDG6967408.1 hypothetical protein [Nitrososphaerota archaeon]MDG6977839.1 hypothetical protein [Nitrososphaerota archaeon]MDG7005751.1 hypothetical protein [Nitrososphaerota archaeon]MDG7021804.1 hypothetical protein [Nitrososphaerota archaeon]